MKFSKFLILQLFVLLTTPHFSRAHNVQVLQSEGGVNMWLQQASEQPIVALRIAVDVPLGLSETQKPGVELFAENLILKGAGQWDELQLEKELQRFTRDLNVTRTKNEFIFELRFLSKNIEKVAELLGAILKSPRFDAKILEREKGVQEAVLQGALSETSTLAEVVRRQKLFPGAHLGARFVEIEGRYGADMIRELVPLRDLQKVTREDLVKWHKQTFVRDRLKLVLVGDIDRESAVQFVDAVTSGLPAKIDNKKIPTQKYGPPQIVGNKLVYVEKEDAKATVLFALPAFAKEVPHPDRFAYEVLNYIYGGGGFSSRLMEAIRVKRGLTYGIYSSEEVTPYGRIYRIEADTSPEKAKELIEVTIQEMARVVSEGFSEKEVEDAKTFLIGSYPRGFSTLLGVANRLLGIWIFDMGGPDYIDLREGYFNNVTRDQVETVAKDFLVSDVLKANLLTVVAGKAVGLQPDEVIPGNNVIESFLANEAAAKKADVKKKKPAKKDKK